MRTLTTSNSASVRVLFIFIILPVIGVVAMTWVNHRCATEKPERNDFLLRWLGTRELIIDGNKPYSDEVAEKVQMMPYGRHAHIGDDEMRFAYPLCSGVIFTPVSYTHLTLPTILLV